MKLLKKAGGKTVVKMSKSEWQSIGRDYGWLKTAYKDKMELGPNPSDEPTVQLGEENYRQRAIEEGSKYINLIRQKLGPEPEGARLKITSNPHDFGTYYEVVCEYDDQIPESISYAYACESDGPKTWDDTTPVEITPIEDDDGWDDYDDYEDDVGISDTPRDMPNTNLPPSLPGWD